MEKKTIKIKNIWIDLIYTYRIKETFYLPNIKLEEKAPIAHSAQVAVSYWGYYYRFFARMLISRIVYC